MNVKKGTHEKERKMIKGFLSIVFILCAVFFMQYAAKADSYLLWNSSVSLFEGDALTIADYFDKSVSDGIQMEAIQYTISEDSQDKDCIAVDTTGAVTALKQGSAVVNVTYIETEAQAMRTESFYVTVLAPEQCSADYGSTIWLTAFNMYYPSDYSDGESEKYQYTFSSDSAVLEEYGNGVLIRGFQTTEVYLEYNGKKILVAQITVNVPRFAEKAIARATGTEPFYPVFENYMEDGDSYEGEGIINLEKPEWTTADSSVLALGENGFQPVSTGKTKITARFRAENGDELLLVLNVTVTNPKLTSDVIVLAAGVSKKFPIKGVCNDSAYFVGKNQVEENMDTVSFNAEEYGKMFSYAYINDANKLCGSAEGIEDAVLIVDGRKLTLKIVVTNPHYENVTFTMYKSLKKSIPIKGLNSTYSTITYTSANTKKATVTENGKVTAKKVGTVKIKVKADGKTFPVWVEIASKKGYQAAKKEIAISQTKTQYSQAKRMSKGYYDCSSLVSRVYRKYGVYFGSKSGWSPTAAGIAQWCAEHKKVLSKKALPYTKLVPGDLIFYSYMKNGRYLNISHVEMYVGNGMSVSASSSNNRVIHYGYSTAGLVMIARPTK